MESKSDLRLKAKDIRKTLDIKNISEKLCERIRNLDIYNFSKNVMIFYPMKYETDLRTLLNDDKKFYLPKVQCENLCICPYSADLIKSEFNVYEPCTKPANPEVLDLIFVPALMVDKNNYRLGYGGGFYDRFLANYPNVKTIVPIAKELLVEKLPHDEFDVKVDEIIFY